MLARETKILLGLLGTLSSGFVGVLGTKLLVPRPPEGAGPDVHVAAEDLERTAIVDPPSFDRPAPSAFALAAPPVEGEPPVDFDEPSTEEDVSAFASTASPPASAAGGAPRDEPLPSEPLSGQLPPPPAFWGGDAEAVAADNVPDHVPDERSRPDSHPQADPEAAIPPPGREADAGRSTAPADSVVGMTEPVEPASFGQPRTFQPPPDAAPISRGEHVVVAGDTWWSLAERAYGDGRLYKPLYAWNRARFPDVAVTAGTRLEVPPVEQLAAAYEGLMPAELVAHAAVSEGILPVSATEPFDRTIVVQPGDTLISIARDQLGSSSRWRDVFEANRETLGRSPGPLTPGTRLLLP